MMIMGVMTGTSCDGLDAVTVKFTGKQFRILARAQKAYPAALRKHVLEFQRPKSTHSSKDWIEVNRHLGDWYANALMSTLRRQHHQVDVIANHGQTLGHFPGIGTLQMGDPSVISAATGLTVVSQFRAGDMAAGGQGAPLVPRFHQLLAALTKTSKYGCAIHNLGGISNLTYIHEEHELMAWDTGPANLWIDLAVERGSRGKLKYDQGGRLARLGRPNKEVTAQLLRHPYFKRFPPKSTGRDDFTSTEFLSLTKSLRLADAAATATLATARSIAIDYCRNILDRGLPLRTIYFSGGGALNRTLLECVQIELLSRGWMIEIRDSSALGIHPQEMEAAAFAFLGKESLLGRALGGTWTGARCFGPPGQITPGANWSSVLKKLSSLR